MTFNIVDLVKNEITDQVAGQMGNLLGGDSSRTNDGLNNAIPGLLKGLSQRASAPGGSDRLLESIHQQDDGLLDNIGSKFERNEGDSLLDGGAKALVGLFGESGLGKLGGMVAQTSGMSTGGSRSLLCLVAPVVMGVLKRKVTDGGLDAGGLMSLLNDQDSNVTAAMPSDLRKSFESSSFMSGLGDRASGAVRNASGAVAGVVAGVASSGSNVSTAAGAVSNTASGAAHDASSAATDAVSDVGSRARDASSAATDAVSDVGSRARDASSAATDAVSDVGSRARDASSAATDAVSDVGSRARDASATATDAVSDVGSRARDASSAATDAVSDVGSRARDASAAATDAVSNVASGAGRNASAATGAASDVASGLTHSANSAVSKGSSGLMKYLPLAAAAVVALIALKFCTSGGGEDTAVQTSEPAAIEESANTTETADTTEATEATTDVTEFDVQGMETEVTGAFENATSTLAGITDVDSATASLPALNEMSDKFGALAGSLGDAPDAARESLSGVLSSGLESLTPILEKVRAIPGVGDIIDPVVKPMIETLQKLVG